jgi:four helix bundle protein
MHNFRELNVWKMSMDIAVEVNIMVEAMPKYHMWTLGSQLLKSSVSVPSNIAEGCGRISDGQFQYFLNVAMASSFELETQLLLALRFNTVNTSKAEDVLKNLNSVQKMTRKLLESLSNKK